MADDTLLESFERLAGRPRSDAIGCLGVRYATDRLLAASRSLAAGLESLGVAVGDRVGIYAHNCPEHVVLLLANCALGSIHVGYTPTSTPAELTALLRHSEPAALLVPEPLVGAVRTIGDDLTTVPRLIAIPATDDASAPRLEAGLPAADDGTVTIAELLASTTDLGRRPRPSDDLAIWYSSGTTGRPKGAVWTNAALCASALGTAYGGRLSDADRVLKASSMAQVGLVSSVFGPLLAGAGVEVLERFSATESVRAIDDVGITFTTASPTLLRILLHRADELGSELASLRAISVGGGPASPEQLLEFQHRLPDCEITYVYGATEGPVASGNVVAPGPKLGSPGRAFSDVKIVDDDWNELAVGAIGHVATRMVVSMRGYWNDPALTASVIRDGWLRMTDIGRLDDDGYIWLVGRAAELINCGGHNVFAGEVERVVTGVPGVRLCGVVGVDDETLGEVPVAFVALHAGARERDVATAITAACERELARYKRPAAVHVVADLPLTDLGKVVKPKLRSAEWLRSVGLEAAGAQSPGPPVAGRGRAVSPDRAGRVDPGAGHVR